MKRILLMMKKTVSISVVEVRQTVSRTSSRKATGPDNISNKVLKMCCDQLAEPLCRLFRFSRETLYPSAYKPSCIIPIPTISRPMEKKALRHAALTSNIMKCYERIIPKHRKKDTYAHKDPLQSAYRPHRGNEDGQEPVCEK